MHDFDNFTITTFFYNQNKFISIENKKKYIILLWKCLEIGVLMLSNSVAEWDGSAAEFALWFFGFWFVKKPVAEWNGSVAELSWQQITQTYFWARFVTILWGLLLL